MIMPFDPLVISAVSVSNFLNTVAILLTILVHDYQNYGFKLRLLQRMLLTVGFSNTIVARILTSLSFQLYFATTVIVTTT